MAQSRMRRSRLESLIPQPPLDHVPALLGAVELLGHLEIALTAACLGRARQMLEKESDSSVELELGGRQEDFSIASLYGSLETSAPTSITVPTLL